MNILSLNIRECGSSVKKRSLKLSFIKYDFNIYLLQEIKTQLMNEEFVRSLWRRTEF